MNDPIDKYTRNVPLEKLAEHTIHMIGFEADRYEYNGLMTVIKYIGKDKNKALLNIRHNHRWIRWYCKEVIKR